MLPYSGCLVTRTAAQTISTATSTSVLFDSEIHDTDDFHENAVAPGEISIPAGKGGTYYLYASVEWESNAVGVRFVQIRVNGTAVAESISSTVAGHAYTQATGTTRILSEGDVITVYVHQTSGGDLDIERNSYSPRFGVDLLGV